MPGVLMLETLTQVAAALVLDREGPMPMSRVYLHGVDGAKFRRQVVPGDQLRLEVTLLKARTSLAKARGVAYVGDQIVAEMDLLLAVMPDGVRIHPTAVVMKGAADRRRHGRRPERGHRRARPARQALPHRRVGGRRRVHRDWRRNRDFSVRVDRPHPAGPQVQGRGNLPQDRKAQHLPRVRHDPPRHARGRRQDDDRRSQRVHGVRARRARLPHRRRHDLREQRHAGRARVRRRLRDHQRRVGRPSVLPHRPPRVHRRLFGRHQGRAAVREDRRQSRAHLRPEHDRPDAPRVYARSGRQAEARVSVSADVAPEHDARAQADRAGRDAGVPRGAVPRRLHPHLPARRAAAPADPRAEEVADE